MEIVFELKISNLFLFELLIELLIYYWAFKNNNLPN